MTDYAHTLFPIEKAVVDWPLYCMVSGFVKYKYGIDKIEYSDIFESVKKDKEEEDRKYSYYFVFPSEDYTCNYNEEMLGHEYLILKYIDPEEHVNGEPFVSPDDSFVTEDDLWYEDVPMEYFCFPEGKPMQKLVHNKTQALSRRPVFPYNGDLFFDAVQEVRSCMDKNHLTELTWFARLRGVKQMLNDDINELHILHNAGLYDHNTLWSCLKENGIHQDDIDKLKDNYVSQLKKYAMFVLNRLDWKYGTTIRDKNCRRKKTEVYEPLTAEQMAYSNEVLAKRLKMKMVRQPQKTVVKPVVSEPKETPRAADPVQSPEERSPKQTPPSAAKKQTIEEISLKQTVVETSQNQLPDSRPSSMEPATSSIPTRGPVAIILSLMVSVFVVFVGLAFIFGTDAMLTSELQWGLGVIFFMIVVHAASNYNGYSHRHPTKIRVLLIFLAAVLPFFFLALGELLMSKIASFVPPAMTFVFIFVISCALCGVSVVMRRSKPDDKAVLIYTILVIASIMAVVGNFIALLRVATHA